MKKIIIKFILAVVIPGIFLLTIYIIIDPFCVLRSYSPDYYSNTAREHVSTEMFIYNNPKYKFNSFIFGSSRCCFVNSYVWKDLLEKNTSQTDTISQFVFQGWIEDLVGIHQKMQFLERNNVLCNNALILIDVPSSFDTTLNSVKIQKHYLLSGMPKWKYQLSFVQRSILKPYATILKVKRSSNLDTITNDWRKDNRLSLERPPRRTEQDADRFLVRRPDTEEISKPLITPNFEAIFRDMKRFFDVHHTNYRLVITPTYYKIRINPADWKLLCDIFGSENIFDYSGNSRWANDMYNFDDVLHFDHPVGWDILHDIYDKKDSINAINE
ncbi:MAG: hypothetical protein LBV75_08710 [Paludibacter sp.]|jgi:hypothetical protein|nr:hypothetical protein [Paludibacter sp.]